MDATQAPAVTAADLEGAVERALWELDAVRVASQRPVIRVRADGSVELSGPVRSRIIADQILEIARTVPGVGRVINRLVSDPELEITVARALQMDGRTAHLPAGAVAVRSTFGVVTLIGRISSPADREAIRAAAAAVPGVVEINDRLT